MPLSAEALCWKKIIHGVTVAPIVEASSSSSVLKLPPGNGREVERAGDRADMRLDEDRRDQEQPVEQRHAEHDPLPAPVAPAAEREHDQRQAEHDGDARAEMEVGQPDADRDELGDQRDRLVSVRSPAPNQPQTGP